MKVNKKSTRLKVTLRRLKNGMFPNPASLPLRLMMPKNMLKKLQVMEATRYLISILNCVKFAPSQQILFGKIDILPNPKKTNEKWSRSVSVA
jgi:hypothetical protein